MKEDKKVLCFAVDDEPKALSVLERLLGLVAPDWEVKTFSSGKQLIAQAKQTEPDVLFSDIEMPDMSGFKLIEGLKEISVLPVTVLVTGYDHYAIRAIKEAVVDYILKPVDIDDLRETVGRVTSKLNNPAISIQIEKISILTATEKEVLKLLSKGHTSAETAEMLNSSIHTINTHRNHILQKMNCKSILEVLNKMQSL